MASSQVSDEAALLHILSSCSNLQDTLSGDCKFIVLLHVSTQLSDHAHTLETFEFANRIRRVELSKILGDNILTTRRFVFSKRHDYFKEDSTFNPREPKYPLGILYDSSITMASQRMFTSLEYLGYQSPLAERTFAIGATTTQNFAASIAYKVIGETSPYSIPRPYTGVGGAYAFSRLLVPLAVTFGWKMYENHVEKKVEKEREAKVKIDLDKVGSDILNTTNKLEKEMRAVKDKVKEDLNKVHSEILKKADKLSKKR